MNLVQLKNLSLSFGAEPILDQINIGIDRRDRIALVGRNGTGKSTLLNTLLGRIDPDEGEVLKQDGLIIRKLDQNFPADMDAQVQSIIAQGNRQSGQLLAQYYQILKSAEEVPAQLQQQLNDSNAWEVHTQTQKLVSKFNLNAEADFSKLSGGQKRRVLLAQSLIDEPDLLLLDEPTNHLDIDTIEWMEKLLLGLNTTLFIVSHDRAFINKLATKIFDLDRGQLTVWPGNFDQYLTAKTKLLEDEANQNKAFDKKLAQEEVWIRKGIQARRTRNEGRVRALKKLRQQYAARRNTASTASFDLNLAKNSGQLVAEIKGINYSVNSINQIIKNFSATILRGDKIGIIGPNGCGKSTVIKLLTGELEPSSGEIKHGTRIQSIYLDQHRSIIDNNKTLIDNVAEGRSEVEINGKPLHIMSYLQEFLFSADRVHAPAGSLSGGERNRLALAKLFTLPFNLLILDEPTNDLDIDTLELLEQKLVDYQGTLLLVSHDRTFINNIVTSTYVFEGDAKISEYVGGYDDWLRQRPQINESTTKAAKPVKTVKENTVKPKKLSYKHQRELEQLPELIEQLESEQDQLTQRLAEPDFYQQDAQKIKAVTTRLSEIESELSHAYQRWDELEA